jgi:hypothetical protein
MPRNKSFDPLVILAQKLLETLNFEAAIHASTRPLELQLKWGTLLKYKCLTCWILICLIHIYSFHATNDPRSRERLHSYSLSFN